VPSLPLVLLKHGATRAQRNAPGAQNRRASPFSSTRKQHRALCARLRATSLSSRWFHRGCRSVADRAFAGRRFAPYCLAPRAAIRTLLLPLLPTVDLLGWFLRCGDRLNACALCFGFTLSAAQHYAMPTLNALTVSATVAAEPAAWFIAPHCVGSPFVAFMNAPEQRCPADDARLQADSGSAGSITLGIPQRATYNAWIFTTAILTHARTFTTVRTDCRNRLDLASVPDIGRCLVALITACGLVASAGLVSQRLLAVSVGWFADAPRFRTRLLDRPVPGTNVHAAG